MSCHPNRYVMGLTAVLGLAAAGCLRSPGPIPAERLIAELAGGAPITSDTPSSGRIPLPPKGCRGGADEGRATAWVLELWESYRPWYRRRWVAPWRTWATASAVVADSGRVSSRLHVPSNWVISLELERDDEKVEVADLGYLDVCLYAHRSRYRDYSILFYRRRP